MDAASRKSKILCCIVEQYIDTAEPVGSKQLLESSGLSVSSATVRNDMAALSQAGLIDQPYTSAGRVPTQEGFRRYLEVAAKPIEPTAQEKAMLLRQISASADDPEHILDSASKALSQLSGAVCAATTPPPEDVKIAKLRLIQTGRQTAMTVLVTSSGMVKYKLFRCDYMLTKELVKVFERILSDTMVGRHPEEITPAFVQSLAASFGELAMLMPTVLSCVMQQCSQINSMDVRLHGESNLLLSSDFELSQLREIIKFLGRHEQLAYLLLRADKAGGVMIGTETQIPELYKCAVISRRYDVAMQPSGAIGLIAPMRNSYRRNLGLLEYACFVVGKLINELLES